MTTTKMRSAAFLASGLIAGAMLVGCSPAATGGDTSCKDYLAANDQDQTSAVTKMLKDEKGADAAQLEITGTKVSVGTWCQTVAKPDQKIKEAPHL